MLMAFVLMTGSVLGKTGETHRIIQASEILTKIAEHKPVNYTYVTIEGNLNFNDGFVGVGKSYHARFNSTIDQPSKISGECSCFAEQDTNSTLINSTITNSIIKTVVRFNNSLIQVPVILTNSTLISSPIIIRDSIIKGVVQFNKTSFQEPIIITNTAFYRDAYFVNSNFSNGSYFANSSFAFADFALSNFSIYTNFENTKFRGLTAFPGAKFTGYANFEGAQFGGYADFFAARILRHVNARYSNKLNSQGGRKLATPQYGFMEVSSDVYFPTKSSNISFNKANFSGNANFVGAEFNQSISFYGVGFRGPALFALANFTKDAFFGGANFVKGCDFLGTNFTQNADFEQTVFNGYAKFPNSRINNSNFKGATFAGNATFHDTIFIGQFLLDQTKFTSIQLENAWFGKKAKLSLDDSDLTRSSSSFLLVSWDSIQNNLEASGPVYLALIRNFKNLEQFDDADNCYYQYRKWRQDETSWTKWSKYNDILAWLSCGYGVKPSYVLGWFIFLIGSFGFISWVGNGLKSESNQYSSEKVSLGDAFYYSLMVFIGASTVIKPVGRYKYLLPVERIFGWLLLALFITTLGHVMIR
jgi:hypothetical protein